MTAAAVTTRALAVKPVRRPASASRGVDVLLAHPRDQEDLVVHGEAEQHAHQDDRQEARSPAPPWPRSARPPTSPTRRPRPPHRTRRRPTAGNPASALIGTAIERNTSISRSSDSPITTSRERQQRAGQPVGDVDGHGGLTGDPHLGDVVPLLQRRRRSLRIRSTRAAVAGSVCDFSGITCTMPRSALRFGVASATASTPSSSPMSLGRGRPSRRRLRGPDDVDGDEQGRVEARAEVAADEVVRRPLGACPARRCRCPAAPGRGPWRAAP